jgi:hypothetical protein
MAVVEEVTTSRSRDAGSSGWSRWVERKHSDTEEALAHFESTIARKEKYGFRSLLDQGILLPMNDTDLRHFRHAKVPPRAALEYASQLYDGIYTWWTSERAKALEEHTKTAATPPPRAPSVISAGKVSVTKLDKDGKPIPGSARSLDGTITSDSFSLSSKMDLTGLQEELMKVIDPLGDIKKAGF